MTVSRPAVPTFKTKDVSPYRNCQWPFGEPGTQEFHFCGRATFGGFSYCAEHVQRAYRAPEPRRTAPPAPMPGRRAA